MEKLQLSNFAISSDNGDESDYKECENLDELNNLSHNAKYTLESITLSTKYIKIEFYDFSQINSDRWFEFVNNIKQNKKDGIDIGTSNGNVSMHYNNNKNYICFEVSRYGSNSNGSICIKYDAELCIDAFNKIYELYSKLNIKYD
jgi:hypothetical protein